MNLRTRLRLYSIGEKLNYFQNLANALALTSLRVPVLGALGVGVHLAQAAIDYFSIQWNDAIVDMEAVPGVRLLGDILRQALEPHQVLEDGCWALYDVEGRLVVRADDRLYTDPKAGSVVEFLAGRVWPDEGERQLVPSGDKVELRVPDARPVLPSSRADAIWRRTVAFLKGDEPRSMILKGPPGTGKSSIATYLAGCFVQEFGGRVLRLSLKDFCGVSAGEVKVVLDFLKPEVVILDDIDRFGDLDAMLDVFETYAERHCLVVATCNDFESMSAAVTRPERFDDVHEIVGLAPELLEPLLGGLFAELEADDRAELLTWPAAYVADLGKRYRLLGADFDYAHEMAELAGRLLAGNTIVGRDS